MSRRPLAAIHPKPAPAIAIKKEAKPKNASATKKEATMTKVKNTIERSLIYRVSPTHLQI
jgi:hypothetical protein